jgi:hypothetical protein
VLVFSPQSLAFIAVPKTGSTAVEMALKPKADIVFSKQRKHMTALKFDKKIAPFLAQAFDLHPDRIAVLRDPEEQIRSWYRFRARPNLDGSDLSTRGISFDRFVRDVIAQDRPAHAAIGSQWNMLTGGAGQVLVHHLFAYETQPVFRSFLNDRFGQEIKLKPKNVSPQTDAPLDPATRAKLRVARQNEFDLYARVMDAGGHLRQSLD